jgi:DNA-binding transcriptional LysR family regulator
MKLEHLRMFLAVVDAGELAQAGDRVGRTPAALSMTLKQLESELGGPLFEGERKIRLSPLGVYVRAHAQRAIAEYDSAVAHMLRYASGALGTAKVAAVPSAATRLLPQVIGLMRRQYPRVRVDLRDIDSAAVGSAVASGAVDFGVATLPEPLPGILAEPLFADRFVLVCPAGHSLTKLGRDVDAAEFIANGLCARFNVPEVAALVEDSLLTVRNTTSLLTFVEQGFGVTILPALAVPAADGLAILPLADQSAARSLELLTRRGETLSPASQALLGLTRTAAAELAPAWS